MADTSKEKIIKISTQGAEKNVKSLKTQIRELREELGTLEKGTADYDRVAKELADTNQRQIEVNEAMKYANKDIGATLSNLTSVTAGVVGAIQGVNVVMQAFGASEEDAAKAAQTLQQTMALIQSLSAIDTARKALHGLSVAFGDLGKHKNVAAAERMATAETKLATAATAATAAEAAETKAINTNTAAKAANAAGTAKTLKAAKQFPGVIKLITNAVKVFGATLKSALGIVGLVVAGIAALVTVIKKHNEKVKEAREEAERFQNAVNGINTRVQQEQSHLENLINALNGSNRLYSERQAIVDQLNKEYPSLNAKIDKHTGLVTMDTAALSRYNAVLGAKVRAEETENLINEQIAVKEEKRLALEQARAEGSKKKIKEAEAAYQKELNYLRQLQAEYTNLNLAAAFTDLTVTTTTTTTTNIKRTVTEMLADLKKTYKEFLGEFFNYKTLKNTFNGLYSETQQLLDKMKYIVKVNGIGDALSEEFKKAFDLATGKLTGKTTQYDITLDFVFNPDTIKNLEKQLNEEEELYQKYLKKEINVTEAALKVQQNKVTNLKEQISAYNEFAETMVKYLQVLEAEEKENGEEAIQERIRLKQQEADIYQSYINDVRSNNPWAEINNDILQNEANLENVNSELQKLIEEEKTLNEGAKNKATVERLEEIATKRKELEEKQLEYERSLDEARYQERLQYLEGYYETEKNEAEKAIQDLKNQRNALGGGVMDYNTDVDALNLQLQAIKNQYAEVERYYGNLMSALEQGSDEWIQLEIEKQAALTTLEEDGAKKRAEITQSEVDRKKKIQQTYMDFLGSVTGQIQNLLSEKMNSYDQDSQAYKRLQISQATITTLEGALSAFMSGFQSGIPFPGNLAAAVALSGLVFRTGLQQIENIKKESLNNSATSTPTSGNFGEYDTLSYAQNSDILATLEDSRVYVTESDITSTQRRVAVRESESTF